jgi:hypothetical protein
MTEYLHPDEDFSPERPERSSNPQEELRRAQADWDALLGWWERRYPVSGPKTRWDVSERRLIEAKMRLVVAARAAGAG